jgi:diphthamide synthase (EF-2-diphthine--ammonia ligase)
MKKHILSYSGGKDSHYVLYKLLKKNIKPICLNLVPLSFADGIKYFNSPYKKELIEIQSKLMGIEIFYFKPEKKLMSFFRKNHSLFLEKLFSRLHQLFGDIDFYIGNDRNNMRVNYEKIKLMKSIAKVNGINLVFPLKNMDLDDIISETSKYGIKSVCIGIEKPEFFHLVGKTIDFEFLKIVKENGINSENIQSFVIESPLFNGTKIEITSFRKKRIRDRCFLEIFNYHLHR